MADIKNPERRGFESSGEESGQGEHIREQASQAADKTREAAAAARDRVSEQAYSYADQGKQRLAEAIHDIAVSIREAGHKLHEEQQEGPAGYVDRTADQVDNVAKYLEQHDVDELYQSVEDTARRHPAVFLGAVFATGLVAARFLRSSADRRRSTRRQLPQSQGESGEHESSARSQAFARAHEGSSSGERQASPPSPSTPSGTSGPYPPASSAQTPPQSPSSGATKPPTDQSAEGGGTI